MTTHEPLPTIVSVHNFGDGHVPAHRHANGGGWVAETASVDDASYIGPSACVYGRAVVTDSKLFECAKVFDEATVKDAVIGSRARVFGSAEVMGATVTEDAWVHGNAKIYPSLIQGFSHVFCDASVGPTKTGERRRIVLSGRSIVVCGCLDVPGDHIDLVIDSPQAIDALRVLCVLGEPHA